MEPAFDARYDTPTTYEAQRATRPRCQSRGRDDASRTVTAVVDEHAEGQCNRTTGCIWGGDAAEAAKRRRS
jgi:hypothetical protein